MKASLTCPKCYTGSNYSSHSISHHHASLYFFLALHLEHWTRKLSMSKSQPSPEAQGRWAAARHPCSVQPRLAPGSPHTAQLRPRHCSTASSSPTSRPPTRAVRGTQIKQSSWNQISLLPPDSGTTGRAGVSSINRKKVNLFLNSKKSPVKSDFLLFFADFFGLSETEVSLLLFLRMLEGT